MSQVLNNPAHLCCQLIWGVLILVPYLCRLDTCAFCTLLSLEGGSPARIRMPLMGRARFEFLCFGTASVPPCVCQPRYQTPTRLKLKTHLPNNATYYLQVCLFFWRNIAMGKRKDCRSTMKSDDEKNAGLTWSGGFGRRSKYCISRNAMQKSTIDFFSTPVLWNTLGRFFFKL